MTNKEHIGKVIEWSNNPGQGWIRTRISKCEIREYAFNASTKQVGYQPVCGDRVSFELTENRKGLAYIRNVMYLMTGN